MDKFLSLISELAIQGCERVADAVNALEEQADNIEKLRGTLSEFEVPRDRAEWKRDALDDYDDNIRTLRAAADLAIRGPVHPKEVAADIKRMMRTHLDACEMLTEEQKASIVEHCANNIAGAYFGRVLREPM